MQSCIVIQPNQLGLKQRLGKLHQETLKPGSHFLNPFTSIVYRYDMRIQKYNEIDEYPTQEGLEVKADMNLLYHIKPEAVRDIHLKFGPGFQKQFISSNFRSIIREVYIRYDSKELIIKKEELEDEIIKRLKPVMAPYGFEVDDVLVSDIDLPAEVNQAIKNKVKAEQVAKEKVIDIENDRRQVDFDIEKQRKVSEFSVEQEKRMAERKQIEAEAIKKYQLTINESITEKLLKYKELEITKELVNSPNSKLIITDGKSPVTIHANGEK